MSGRLTLQIKLEWSCRPADSVTWKWKTSSQLAVQFYQDFLEKQNTMARWHNQNCREVLEICCSSRYTQSLPQWEWRFRRCLVNQKSAQKAIRWYIGVLIYQCLLSYELVWKKQAATLTVQDNSFNSTYAVWICKPASNQATECIIWASCSFIRGIALF